MNIDTPTPQEVGLPHKSWRKAQGNAFFALRDAYESRNSKQEFHFAQLPTGTGKTGVAAALGSIAPVTYVAATLGLLDQAERDYGFVPIKGRQEYDCAHPKRIDFWQSKYGEIPTARDCHLDKMTECPYAGECEYLIAKNRALMAQRSACTYKYLALSSLMRKRRGILILDECHSSVSEIISLASFEINGWTIDKWDLPDIPWRDRVGPSGRGDILDAQNRGKFASWASQASRTLEQFDPQTREGVQAKRLRERISLQVDRMQGSEWFIEAGPGVVSRFVKGKKIRMKGIVLRPLSAQHVARRLWAGKEMVLLMSATIGQDPKPLAKELGIEDWQWHDYPHPVPISARPIYDLGVERLTKRNLDNNPQLYVIQALRIVEFIQGLPEDWRGIVLTSSYKKIGILKPVLKARLGDRVFEAPINSGVSERIAAFIKDPRQGLVSVDTVQGWGHGLDLRGDLARFVVVAGVPFENPSDPFVKARRKEHDAFYWWNAYTSIPQAAGRVSRGEITDSGDFLVNVAAIADGSALSPRAKKHFPSWFKAVKWNGERV